MQRSCHGAGTELYVLLSDLADSLQEYLDGNKMDMDFYM